MNDWLALLEICLYGLAFWLGLFLLLHPDRSASLALTGLGLLSYGLALAVDLLAGRLGEPVVGWLASLLMLLPALAWSAALLALLPADQPPRRWLASDRRRWLAPGLAGLLLLLAGAEIVAGRPAVAVGVVAVLPLGLALTLVWALRRSGQPGSAPALLVTVSLFFTLGSGLLLAGPLLPWLARGWLLPALGGDLVVLGVAVAWTDAFEAGERLRPELLRGLLSSLTLALLFGLPAGLPLLTGAEPVGWLLGGLLLTIALAVALPLLADRWQTLIDSLLLRDVPLWRRERSTLRTAVAALERRDPALTVAHLTPAERERLVRRALSHYGDLGRLAANPLTQLPAVEMRLARQRLPDDTLTRATELRALLEEAIVALKPRGQGDFGTSDAWRYYNALYFPYVVGLRPYSRRAVPSMLPPAAAAALDWLRESVPERTLHNWQTAAARLVAQRLHDIS